jgi:hypothetical protein
MIAGSKFSVLHKCPLKCSLLGTILLLAAYSAAQLGQFDGPAELPRVYVRSAVSDTPAPGKKIRVNAGESLQSALNTASCGDTIELQMGEVFVGVFHFPQKPCDDSHWIIVRTSAPDSALPPEGTRLKPCFAGVPSLPGRPDFRCSASQRVLAEIKLREKDGIGPLIFQPGANHYRLVGLEISRSADQLVSALAVSPQGGPVDHVVFDRVWMHGEAQVETTRALSLTGMSYVAIVDSFFTDFHCVAVTGSCTDAQVLWAGGGNSPSGPFKIVNNFLEASGENILFGGAPATMTPADIEIRGNHMFKPMIWKPGEPGFVSGASGRPFIVKNLFELKNAQRVLFEGNLLENCWGGFSQNGYAILLTPKSQGNRCPLCRVTDVTIRYSRISNVGSAFQVVNIKSDAGGETTAGERYSIHDLLVTDVRGKPYAGTGLFLQLMMAAPPLQNVRIEHVTAFVPHAVLGITNHGRFSNFAIENNIFSTGEDDVESEGGGPTNCAYQPQLQGPRNVIKNCFVNSSFTHNLMIGNGGWPSGNPSVKDMRTAGIRELHGPGGKPYELCKEKDKAEDECKTISPALRAGTDGKDLGANLDRLEQMLANVE